MLIISLLNLLALLDTNAVNMTARGSLCFGTLTSISINVFLAQGVLALGLIAICYIIVVLFSVLIVKYVNKNTIDNKKAVRDVLIIMVALSTSVIIFRQVPVLRFVIQSDVGIVENISIPFIIDYSIDFSYPLFLVLTLFVHKTVRTTFFKTLKCNNVKKIFGKPSNRILDSSSSLV